MVKWCADHVRRWLLATRCTCQGLAAVTRAETAFRQELVVLAIVLPLGLWLGHSGVERALLIGSWLLVLVVELINSAIEAVVNRIGPERHTLSGMAKDIGSAAVGCAIILALTVWALVLVQP